MVKRIAALFLCFLSALSIGGVFAGWTYYEKPAVEAERPFSVSLSPFNYKPEEILPGGDASHEEVALGENHFRLVELVLNEDGKGYGLNISTNGVLHSYLKRYDYVYCNQKVSGGNLKHILSSYENTDELYYCLKRISDTEYHCYTFSYSELDAASGTDTEIQAYKTILVKTDMWRATTSYNGHALTVRLSDLGVSADSQSLKYTINIDSWHPAHK